MFNEVKLFRERIRAGEYTGNTSGICGGYQQKDYAHDFEQFCRSNKQSCPILSILPAGEKEAKDLAPDSDITTDIPKYRIWNSPLTFIEETNIINYWSPDYVTFFFGCSFSFENALIANSIPVRNIEQKKNVSMFKTNIDCQKSQYFSCPLVVSYRPIPKHLVEETIRITKLFESSHGAPVHIGDPSLIGIVDINKPDYGDAVIKEEGDVDMFWACGVTSTLAAVSVSSETNIVISHSPGHMFITDIKV